MKVYDAIVIGSGQAGTPLSKKLAQAGKNTALIEKRWVGGTCINDGCTPTKAMVASARAAYLAARCTDLGVTIGQYHINMGQVKQRKDEIVGRFRNGSAKAIEQTENLDLIYGQASFTGPKTISIKLNQGDDIELKADLIFINTGTAPLIPEIDGLQEINYLTSTSILDLDKVPEHLLIIGGNYVALEFGQMFRRFGSKVSIIERGPHIMSHEDEDVAGELTNILKDEGIDIYTNATTGKLENTEGKITATINVHNQSTILSCSHVLIATGRTPQTHALNLEATGVMTDDKGFIKVNDKLESNTPGIYALGDVKGGPAFTHISYHDFTVVYRNLFEGANISANDHPIPYCMFTDPQLGRIGLTEKQAREQGLNIKVAKLSMKHVARAIETGETRGLMKAIVDAETKQILGAAILGEQGGEIMAVLEMAMQGKVTYEQIRYCIFAHPTYAESLNNLFMAIEE